MVSSFQSLFKNVKSQTGRGLLQLLIPVVILIVVVLKQSEDNIIVTKREQKLQIDVAFIIHGSENITSPPRVKTYKESLKWMKKIIKAFGEIGINKTRVGLMLFAEKPKLMFNFTQKLTKGDVLGAIGEAEQPPVLGNATLTGKALWHALATLASGVRKAAVKKFFVFSDRPPEDAALPPAIVILKKGVDIYGLGQTTAPSDWYIHDYDMDSMYTMMAAGPFKWKNVGPDDTEVDDTYNINVIEHPKTEHKVTKFHKKPEHVTYSTKHGPEPSSSKINHVVTMTNPKATNTDFQRLPENIVQDISSERQEAQRNPPHNTKLSQEDTKFHKELAKITYSVDHLPEPRNKKINQVVTVTTPVSPDEDEILQSQNLPESTPESIPNEQQYDQTDAAGNSDTTIASVISQKVTQINPIHLATNHYGNDASVVITANSVKSGNAVGRYSTAGEKEQYSPTDFGTVIGGVHKEGPPQFSVIKPSEEQESNLRSKVRDSHRTERHPTGTKA